MDESMGLTQLRNDAAKELSRYLKSEKVNGDDAKKARIAASVLGTWARVYSTDGARQRLTLNLAARIAGNKDELRNYIAASYPKVIQAMKPQKKALGK